MTRTHEAECGGGLLSDCWHVFTVELMEERLSWPNTFFYCQVCIVGTCHVCALPVLISDLVRIVQGAK